MRKLCIVILIIILIVLVLPLNDKETFVDSLQGGQPKMDALKDLIIQFVQDRMATLNNDKMELRPFYKDSFGSNYGMVAWQKGELKVSFKIYENLSNSSFEKEMKRS